LLSWVALNPRYYELSGPFIRPLKLQRGMALMDLVIAMPISWVPLISDYSRLARSERGGFWGSFIGYGIMSTWMYAIGLVIYLASGTTDPAANIIVMMGRIGLAVPAIILVFASTVTSDFPDIYSSACSLFNISRRIKPVVTMWATGILTIVLALIVDLSKYEAFLIAIGAFFVPLFALLLTEYFLVRRQRLPGVDFVTGEGLHFTAGWNLPALLVWGIGVVVFFIAQRISFFLGGSITSFAATVVLHLVWSRSRREGGGEDEQTAVTAAEDTTTAQNEESAS
jgi:purine-cytosine permease-like protein